ncbi:MAG: WD40/YVTN/BNR-like repeat-containing protein, partial [Myxococcota bacterium]
MSSILALLLLPATLAPLAPPQEITPEAFESYSWREVGPYRGGRCAAVAGLPGDRQVYYFGAAGGGVWKTEDAGQSWQNVSDGSFGGSIGAVAVSEWDPNVIYVGGGEKTVRGNVSHGDGVWKSTDAGRTWQHVGLADSRHVTRLRIHPKDPERVYASVLGHLFGDSEERGVYRTTDGGETWQQVLTAGPAAGAVDLILDPTNPRILYASTWRIRRTPYSLESGGEGSALWKSTDGGDTWEDISSGEGLPEGPLGIIGVTVSPTDPDNLYAMVEAEEGGLFRSRDAGETWKRVHQGRELRQRAWYYTRVYADPKDAETVYVLNVGFHRSKDGGKSFQRLSTPHGDNHDLWIDPADPLRMIQSNDGGANVSFDGGQNWSTQSNQPTAQMYRVSVDDSFPYRLLGGQQDNSTVRIRSRSFSGSSIGTRDWESSAGGESGHVMAKPGQDHIVYGGSYGGTLTRVNHHSGERRSIHIWPDDPMGWGAAELKYRFNWNFPLLTSQHDSDRLYAAANVLFMSTDEGSSWTQISPDLTRDDKSKQESSGGPITKDNTSVEYHGTIFAAAESPLEQGLLWCGSDDGLLHVSRDDGATWSDVTPTDLPKWAQINSIEVHPRQPGGLYVAATNYRLDDNTPYLFATRDYGATWARIDSGIPRHHFTRVVRAD